MSNQICLSVPFKLCFRMILLLIMDTLWDLFFNKKLEKQSLGTTRSGHEKKVRKDMIFQWLEPRKMSPRESGSMNLMFCPTPERPPFWGCFGTSFWSFWGLLS